jgi:hypothetical protein
METRYFTPGLLVLALAFAGSVAAQTAPPQNGDGGTEAEAPRVASLPSVFMDCNGPNCNQNYYRTEIDWVNWVRDPGVSDVHVIVTSQMTGGGGREYLMDFSGGERFPGYTDRVVLRTQQGNTERESLDQMTHMLSLGLARFAASNGYPAIVRIEGNEIESASGVGGGPRSGIVSAEQVNDPWNLWTFRVGGNANLSGQETRETINLRSNFNASRVTPSWRMSFGGNLNFERQKRELNDSTLHINETNYGFNGTMVNALAGHWSGGFTFDGGSNPSNNQDFNLGVKPAVEFSYFPYDEATRRSLTVMYEAGPSYRNYIEETVFGVMNETKMEHNLAVEFSQRQTWGDASVTVNGSQFLDDTSKYRFAVRGDVSFRIFRGLNVNANANWSRQNNQVWMSAEGVTDEEDLLGIRNRASSFNYGMMLGLSYNFGSIFNNVVNNRFGGGGPGRGGGAGGIPGGGGGGGGRGGG